MSPLIAVSGAECVEALLLAGFVRIARNSSSVTLTRDRSVVVVPSVVMLAPDELSAILRAAAIPYTEFLELLSDTPTDPAISRTRFVTQQRAELSAKRCEARFARRLL